MKKILTVATLGLLLSSSLTTAFAEAENEFYLKVGGSALMLNKAKDSNSSLSMKGKVNPALDLAVGYYVMENTRMEVSFNMPFNPKLNKNGEIEGTKGKVSHKGNINSIMVNGYVDLADMSVAKIFLGAGVGVAQVKEKINYTSEGKDAFSISSKKVINVVYNVGVGAASEIATGVNAELAYRFIDYGKTKNKITTIDGEAWHSGKTKYKGHNVVAAIRFDI